MKENPVSTVVDYLLETHTFKLKNNSLYIGANRVSNIFKEIEKDDDLLDKLGIFRHTRSSTFHARDFNTSLVSSIKDSLQKEQQDKAYSLIGGEDAQMDASLFKIYKDIEVEATDKSDKDKFLVLREDSTIVQDVAISTYRHMVTEPVYQTLKPKIPLAYRKFDPYKLNETPQDKRWLEYSDSFKTDVTHINNCAHPSWRYNRDKTLKITEEDKFFIESCFTSKEDLQYYINSAYHTVITKMWSYVMLIGVKGTGKTTLIEMLIPCVGANNYRKAPQNALKKEFNDYKKNKRLVLMDEMVADTSAAINILKSDANKEFNVEGKSKETESVKNFVSVWIATNNVSDWKFTYDERRFSVVELTKQTTQERKISDEYMSDLSERIESEEWAQAFYNYLEENKTESFNTMAPHKTSAFWKVVYESLSMWEMKIVDEITRGEKVDELHISNLFDEREKFQPKTHKKVTDFLENYRHEGKHKLGSYVRGRSVMNSSIVPSEVYRVEKQPLELDNQ